MIQEVMTQELTTSEDLKSHLVRKGFRLKGTCQCSGIYTEKFILGDDVFYVRMKNNKFAHKKHGITVKSYTLVKDFLTYYKN